MGHWQCYQGVHYIAEYEAQIEYLIHLVAFIQYFLFHHDCLGNFAGEGEDFLFVT